MDMIQISDKLFIAGQPAHAAFSQLAADGCKIVINNRPDHEEPGQPGSASQMAAARSAGLGYSFIPVAGSDITEADIRAFQDAVEAAPGPVLGHCRTGQRTLMLYAIGEVLDGRMKAEDAGRFGAVHGFDLKVAEHWLARRARQVPVVKGFFEPRTSSVQYVVSDPATSRCAIIDPVLDFDEKSGAIATRSADALLAYIDAQLLTVDWILDTHPHADHFSAASYLQGRIGAATGNGEHVRDVQKLWAQIYNLPSLRSGARFWDRLFGDGEYFAIGSLQARVMYSPGHTLASVTFVIGDAAFMHDTMFMPDSGTARADFPGGDARRLWRSIQAILALPDETRLFTGHDYQPGSRHPRWESSVAAQQQCNSHVAGRSEAEFVELREARDRTLPMPKLLLPALQVNIRGGRLPEPEDDGRSYLKIPIGALPVSVW